MFFFSFSKIQNVCGRRTWYSCRDVIFEISFCSCQETKRWKQQMICNCPCINLFLDSHTFSFIQFERWNTHVHIYLSSFQHMYSIVEYWITAWIVESERQVQSLVKFLIFTWVQILLGKVQINFFSHQLWVNRTTDRVL